MMKSILHPLTGLLCALLLAACAPTYTSKSYGRALVTELYKQGYYSKYTYDWEMERISRMQVPEGPKQNSAAIRKQVRTNFGNIAPMFKPPGESSSGGAQYEYVYTKPSTRPYSYTPQPTPVYVQGPAHRPGGGEFTPSPTPVYVQGPAHRPGGGEFTPAPMPEYKYYDRPASTQTEYRPSPAPEYVYHKQPQQTVAANQPDIPPAYVYHDKPSQSEPASSAPAKYVYYPKSGTDRANQSTNSGADSSNGNSGGDFYGFNGKKYKESDTLNDEMAAKRDSLASKTEAGVKMIDGIGSAATKPTLWGRIKGAAKAVFNAPAAVSGVKENGKAMLDMSPQNTGLRGPAMPQPAPLPDSVKQDLRKYVR